MRTILAPYPPPYRGVEIVAKQEFEKENGKALFIGTSCKPVAGSRNLILVKRGPFAINSIELLLKIFVNRKRIDKIEAHYATTFGFLAFFANKILGIKYDVVCHGSDILVNMHKPFYNFFNKLALKNSDKIFVVSKNIGAELIEHNYNHKKIHLRTAKINKKLFRKLGVKKKKQLVFVGAIQKSKGVDLLIDAFAKIAKRFPQYKLLIVGPKTEIGYFNRISGQIKAAGLNGKVVFYGEAKHEELPKLLNESKLFVLLSRTEGYGISLEEALNCGLKAVAANVGGIPEIANKYKSKCVLVNLDIEEIAHAIEKQLK